MAKDKSEAEIREKKEKKEKKDKKRKSSEVDGGLDDSMTAGATPAKKEKKEKKHRKSLTAAAEVVDADGDVVVGDAQPSAVKAEAGDGEEEEEKKDEAESAKAEIPLGAFVPFANPLCDEKAQKKVLKSVKKAAKNKALKRGVKECVKAIRKSPAAVPSAVSNPSIIPPGIVVLAADISPMDVISHIPVLCEDHNIPYVYVPSRAELGAAGSTKRPTSVVMLTPKQGKGAGEEGAGEWEEAYKELYKLSLKLGQAVKV
ncbi:hypothetical protein LTR36_001564 [Oleoguttula mirabilis]|uniref:H/ACA ribonucleoprotein complex subunit 2 n=1 Tax=Oleoguttula mirabilis TaxID=1507867 RepID=A0AAV9JN88_9PEZI|nr:hypothetical protein LTR36_001564 [Oleoguttula mirabilis]